MDGFRKAAPTELNCVIGLLQTVRPYGALKRQKVKRERLKTKILLG